MLNVSMRISNHRSFDATGQGFDSIPNVTVIVGKNNAGKSALLEAIRLMLEPREVPVERGTEAPKLQMSRTAQKAELEKWLQNQPALIEHYGGAKFTWEVALSPGFRPESSARLLSCVLRDGRVEQLGTSGDAIAKILSPATFEGYLLRNIAAERDVRPEKSGAISEPTPSGEGATRLLYNFANSASLPRPRLERDFLEALNSIFEPDCRFESIWVREHASNNWEVFLREEKKGDVPLSRSGSGLKTVILVLCHLILVPIATTQKLKQRIFAFEELVDAPLGK